METSIDFQQFVDKIVQGTVEIYGNLPRNCPDPSFSFVDDICESIAEIDKQYIEETSLSNEMWLGGLLYVNKDNIPMIFIKNSDGSDIGVANMIISLMHELTHFFDYIHYSQYTNIDDLKKLQRNKPFLFWTEFHATYVSILYAIKHKILFIESNKVLIGLKQEFESYCDNNRPLQLESTVNYSSRMFGRFLAWKKTYDELPQYPKEIILNANIGKLCEFFYTHQSFDMLRDDMDKLSSIVYALENK